MVLLRRLLSSFCRLRPAVERRSVRRRGWRDQVDDKCELGDSDFRANQDPGARIFPFASVPLAIVRTIPALFQADMRRRDRWVLSATACRRRRRISCPAGRVCTILGNTKQDPTT